MFILILHNITFNNNVFSLQIIADSIYIIGNIYLHIYPFSMSIR